MQRVRAWALVVLSCLALAAVIPPDDPLVPEQWHHAHVGTFEAWGGSSQGEGTVVAVVDTGVDATHPDLVGRVTGGIDLVERGTPPDDPNGHGTLVAGVIAAALGNGIGGVGVAPQALIMPVRVLDANGTGSSREVAEGIRWAAANGAQIINLSLAEAPGLVSGAGGIVGSDVEAAIREVHADGALVVAASGNEGRTVTPYGPDVPVIVVGASNRHDGVWPHSNRDARTLFAPGVEIISTYIRHGYARADGTSFAAPIVSAGAALLRGAGLSPQQVHDRLYATARPTTGGAGRLDLVAAATSVQATEAGPPPPQPAPSPASPPAAPVEAPEPEPVPVGLPEPAPRSEPPPRPERVVDRVPPQPVPPEPERADVVLRIDEEPVPSRLVPAGIAAALLLANLAGHAVWATRRADGSPLVVWRHPR